jgi:hypothetical protein
MTYPPPNTLAGRWICFAFATNAAPERGHLFAQKSPPRHPRSISPLRNVSTPIRFHVPGNFFRPRSGPGRQSPAGGAHARVSNASPGKAYWQCRNRRRRVRLAAAERAGIHWQAVEAIRLVALTGCRREEIQRSRRVGNFPSVDKAWRMIAGRRLPNVTPHVPRRVAIGCLP